MKKLTDKIYVAGQISASEMDAFAKAGIRTIINNRPEGEDDMQPPGAEIMSSAAQKDIRYFSIPVAGGVSPDQVEAFRTILEKSGEPVLAYCRSGTRSTILWALSQAGTMEIEDILKTAAEAGYDLSRYVPMIESAAG